MSVLLARKGDARPAIRRARAEELASPADAPDPIPEEAEAVCTITALPATLCQQDPDARTAGVAPDSAAPHGFTVRLDRGRHLTLRLIAATARRPVQHLLIEAIDHLIAAHPEAERLAGTIAFRPPSEDR